MKMMFEKLGKRNFKLRNKLLRSVLRDKKIELPYPEGEW